MCIIVFKPKNVQKPSDKILEKCFGNNPDGAGVAIQRNEKIYINKFMEVETYINFVRNNVKQSDNVIYHFRIATHGKVNLENTHPFVITEDYNEMNETDCITTKNVLAHNGVITTLTTVGKDESDSKILANLLADKDINNNLFLSEGIRKLIEVIIETDKLVILNKEGKFILLGHFEKENGIYYSNKTYKYNKFYDYYWEDYITYASPYSGDIHVKKEAYQKIDNVIDEDKIPVTGVACAYCKTKQEVYFYWEVEENLCENCYRAIYLEDG